MNRIDDLVKRLCPDGVEYRPLGEVGTFLRGSGLQKKDLVAEGAPAIHYGQIHTHYGVWTEDAVSRVEPEFATRLKKAQPGDLLIATTSEDDEAVAKAVAWLGSSPVAISGDSFAFHHKLDPKYVSYYFQSRGFQDQKRNRITGTKVRRISASALSGILIPIPPLEVQAEIVGVLDCFTSLEAELEAELEARRQQFDIVCRGSFVPSDEGTDSEDCAFVELGQVVRPNFGERITKARSLGTLFPVYGGGGESFRTDSWNRQDEWVVARFAMSENCVRRVRSSFWLLDSGLTLSPIITDVDMDYVGYWLSSVQDQVFATSTQSAQRNLDINGFLRLKLPWRSLAKQREVVQRLSVLEELSSSLASGLPAEIAARRQQYAYYRDRLLAFEEKVS